MKRASEAGFTLAELLVVLAILALGFSVMLPRTGSSSHVRSRAVEVAALLRLARSEAIFRNAEKTVAIDFAARRIAIPGSAKSLAIAPDIALTVLTARDEIVRENAAIRFLPDGSSTGGAIALASQGTALRVKINWLSGAISIDEVSTSP